MEYIDTHAHLNFSQYEGEVEAVLKRAQKAGVKKIIVVGTDLEMSEKAVALAHKYPQVYAAVGIHPIYVEKVGKYIDKAIGQIKELLSYSKTVAIGEIGLDYYHQSNQRLQAEVFQKLLKLAKERKKPVIFHCREAKNDMLALLSAQPFLPQGVWHCYSEDKAFGKMLLEMDFYLSFTGILTFTKNEDIFQLVKEIPLDRIMIETDCPFLAPEPNRGKRNEPAMVVEVAKKIAEIKGIALGEMAKKTSQNARRLFGLRG